MHMRNVSLLFIAVFTLFILTGCEKSKPSSVNNTPVTSTSNETPTDAIDETSTVSDNSVSDITASLTGIWTDGPGNLYSFYPDGTFDGYWIRENLQIFGKYALVTDGQRTCLALELTDLGGTQYYVSFERDEAITLTNVNNKSDVVLLSPYVEEPSATSSESAIQN